MKRKLGIMLVTLISLTMMATTVFANVNDNEAVTMQMSADTTAESLSALSAGDIVTVYVKAPAVGMSGLEFKINFDSNVFMYDSSDYAFEPKWFVPVIGEKHASTGRIGYSAASSTNLTPSADWNIFTLRLKVKDDAKAGESRITMTDVYAGGIRNSDKKSMDLHMQAATAVTISVKSAAGSSSPGSSGSGIYTPIQTPEESYDETQEFDLASYLKDLQLVARTAKAKNGNVKVRIASVKDSNGKNVDLSVLADKAYIVECKFYRSVKKSSKYKAAVSKPFTEKTYVNTTGKKGTRYFYKAKIVVKDAKGNVVAQTKLNQCRYACRVW